MKGVDKMDIYDYINSSDVAAHCRKINKVWTPFEMAVIIGRSDRLTPDRHNAWRELISDYPDMPTPANLHYKSFDSLHQKLREVIDYEERLLALFKSQEPGTVYVHDVWWGDEYRRSDSVFTNFEKLWADVLDCWSRSEAPEIKVSKINTDDNGCIEAYMDYDGKIRSLCSMGDVRERLLGSDARDVIDFSDAYAVLIPTPFKKGDILTRHSEHPRDDKPVFVLDSCYLESKRFQDRVESGDIDGSDMIEWGLFVGEDGILYGDHTCQADSFEYYRGKFTGNDRLLHYVSLYLNDEIPLPELLTMQCRIMLEHQLKSSLDIQNHGCFISESQLAENRLTQEEKENIGNNGGLMPWVAGKLSIHQVNFLAEEFGGDSESVQNGLVDGGGSYLGRCARIVHNENHYEKINGSKFNPARRAMARIFLEAYGHTENSWVDEYAEAGHDGTIAPNSQPMPDYTKLNT